MRREQSALFARPARRAPLRAARRSDRVRAESEARARLGKRRDVFAIDGVERVLVPAGVLPARARERRARARAARRERDVEQNRRRPVPRRRDGDAASGCAIRSGRISG